MAHILFVAALLFAHPSFSFAQTQDSARKLSAFLDMTSQELTVSGMNLNQMAMGMQSPEMDILMMISTPVTEASWHADKLSQVAFIYSIMLDKRDEAAVKKIAVTQAKQSARALGLSAEQINKIFGRVRSPAAIADVQKARDLIQKIRDEIQRTVPGS